MAVTERKTDLRLLIEYNREPPALAFRLREICSV